jgi:hypothetical protein
MDHRPRSRAYITCGDRHPASPIPGGGQGTIDTRAQGCGPGRIHNALAPCDTLIPPPQGAAGIIRLS